VKRLLLAFAALAAILTGSAVTAAPAMAASTPVVYGMPYGHAGASNFVNGKVQPTGILATTGDGSGWYVIHSWNGWKASATLHARLCWGTCHRYGTEHADLSFYRVRVHNGVRYFTRFYSHLAHKLGGVGSTTLRFYSQGSPAWYYLTPFNP
jgi:hypothetical protein